MFKVTHLPRFKVITNISDTVLMDNLSMKIRLLCINDNKITLQYTSKKICDCFAKDNKTILDKSKLVFIGKNTMVSEISNAKNISQKINDEYAILNSLLK
jgi:hypothetical protein